MPLPGIRAAELCFGAGLATTCGQATVVHIPAGISHLPASPSATEPTVAVVAGTDPNEQKSLVLLPRLDHVPEE